MKSEANIASMQEILDEYVEFFVDQDNQSSVYVKYPRYNGAIALEPVNSKVFEAFLGFQYRQASDEQIIPDFTELIAVIIQDIIYTQANPIRIHRRIAGSINKGKIVYFLADDRWTSFIVTAKGYKSGRSKKLKFLKSALDDEQVSPKDGGDLLKLMAKYVNLSHDELVLFVIFLVQSFSRSSSHFAAILSASKGTGKSTLTKLIRAIVDPSKAGVTIMPSNDSDLKTLLASSYLACFDNTAALSTQFSNLLCAAITGSKEA